MNFKEYLQSKKIDSRSFALAEPERFMDYKKVFDQIHPDSFTAQKLFVINRIRRKYPLSEQDTHENKQELPRAKMIKPKVNIIPKPKD